MEFLYLLEEKNGKVNEVHPNFEIMIWLRSTLAMQFFNNLESGFNYLFCITLCIYN